MGTKPKIMEINSKIESEDCIVCFLDILGYKDLILKEDQLELFYGILYKHIGIYDDARNYDVPSDIKATIHAIKIQILGDALVVIFNLQKFIEEMPKLNISHSALDYVAIFLNSVAILIFELTVDLKYCLRGGITRGKYCQRSLNSEENQFIYSKALAEAYNLQEEASVPRILISSSLYENLMAEWNSPTKKHILEGLDHKHYLDIYSYFVGGSYVKKMLRGMQECVKLQVDKNKNERKILEKYYWLQEYHNLSVLRLKEAGKIDNEIEFLIDVPYYL